MKAILIWSHPICIQGREAYLCDFVKKIFNIGLYSDMNRLIFFKVGMMIEITKLCIYMPVWMNLTFI